MNISERLDLDYKAIPHLVQPVDPPAWISGSRRTSGVDSARRLSPIPSNTLFVGIAEDHLPVLLNLKDPGPGPLLIAGDQGSGKTRLLRIISQSAERSREPENVLYTVITRNPVEWGDREGLVSCEGVLAFHQELTANYLASLVDWAHPGKQGNQYVLLLIDGLEELVSDPAMHQAFSWLLLRGPSRRIWPIVTLTSTNIAAVEPWLGSFRTRLFGSMRPQIDETSRLLLTGPARYAFRDLRAGRQFVMREGDNWLPFTLPDLS